jgi:hypothetical protein
LCPYARPVCHDRGMRTIVLIIVVLIVAYLAYTLLVKRRRP